MAILPFYPTCTPLYSSQRVKCPKIVQIIKKVILFIYLLKWTNAIVLLECILNTQMWEMKGNHDQYCLDL